MATSGTNGRKRVEAVVKTLDVLEALWQAEGAGVTELADRTDLAKSTVHTHLMTLHSKGYVVQDEEEYRLSLRFLSFGEHVKHAEPLYEASDGPITELSEETGERVLCSTHQNGLGAIINVRKGTRSFTSDIGIGTHTYLHNSAGGKAMLAHFSKQRVDEIIEDWGLPAFTEETITDRATLHDELEAIRDDGVAYSTGEYLPGISAIGVPILDTDGTVYGAVTVAGPEHRLENEWEENNLRNQLLSTANTIEVNIMFS
ncbi:IclR family transcriptional regulator [Natrinema halophilum]|uniref:IclR family transcriptional regulator n=1 Tax=Natrinema halophilum TaxID=1699371 RepID=A0A7D5GIU4_9EURY|nr:IclR family transcriptional regulator [Natrinema halophilum]QLG50154.1 IclR family transcriptional regulator [Natrinema halophilum]